MLNKFAFVSVSVGYFTHSLMCYTNIDSVFATIGLKNDMALS